VARTLLDLSGVLPPRQVERAIERAQMLELTDITPLVALLDRYPRRHGTPGLREILSSARGMTRSELEERFLLLIRAAGMSEPERNVHIHAGGRLIEVDCVWRAARLVVELDGYAYHAVRGAFERDRARDRALLLAGWRVVRITWRQLQTEPDLVVADLDRLLRTT
jgi:very-short-patch-repair endonuclease